MERIGGDSASERADPADEPRSAARSAPGVAEAGPGCDPQACTAASVGGAGPAGAGGDPDGSGAAAGPAGGTGPASFAGSFGAGRTSLIQRARRVLAIRPFRRLWGVTYLCSTADWLTLLGLTALVSQLTESYLAQSFAFTGVVLTLLLPGLLFAPLGGLLADRFDRRKVMVWADLARGGLLLSIAVVGEPVWLFIGSFLVGFCSMLWIPCKDAAVPNLLHRPDQMETAAQLNMVMTYGFAVISGAGLYAVVTGFGAALAMPDELFGELGLAKIILCLNTALYLASAALLATRIPELSRRGVTSSGARPAEAQSAGVHPAGPRVPGARVSGQPHAPERPARTQAAGSGFAAMLVDGARYVRSTRLVRGLLVGMLGAFAASGAVVGSAKPYAMSLQAGEAAFGLLFVAVFTGMSLGMAASSRLAERLPHERLFGAAIVCAGAALCLVALAPHVLVALVAVATVGACAGAAFLAGITIIGTRVEDHLRGRINAIYQSLMKVVLGGSLAVVPLLIGLTAPREVQVFGATMVMDGTRPVLFGGGVLAALVGVLAYRQMDTHRREPFLASLLSALHGNFRRAPGLLVALVGRSRAEIRAQVAAPAEPAEADRGIVVDSDGDAGDAGDAAARMQTAPQAAPVAVGDQVDEPAGEAVRR